MKGITYIHEHVRIDLSGIKKDDDCNLNDMQLSIKEFKGLKKLGVDNVVEVTNIGMGRDVEYMEEVAKQSGINIIYSTGFYKEPFLPDFFYKKTVFELAEMMVDELTIGIDGTNIKAKIIGEVGTSKGKITDEERKLLNAAALAHQKTGAPISTHTTLGTEIINQIELLTNASVPPCKIYIGHCDLSNDLDVIIEAAKRGCYVGFDTVGKINYLADEIRAEMIKKLEVLGLIDKVMLSMDITRKSHFEDNGGLGYAYLLETFIPMLKAYDVSDVSIKAMLVDNPKRFLDL